MQLNDTKYCQRKFRRAYAGVFHAIISFGLLVPALANAGNSSGGGGKSVVCTDDQGRISSIQLLDLWEAKTLYHASPVTSANDLPSTVDLLLTALKDSYLYRAHGTDCTDQDCLLKQLKEYAAPFFDDSDARIKRLRGVSLELTDDSFEVARPTGGCTIRQVVNYQSGGDIFIDQDLFEKMPLIDQASLIAHESYYAFLRYRAGETNSIRTRRAIGFVASGKTFQQSKITLPKNHLLCHNSGVPYAPTDIFIGDQLNASGSHELVAYPYQLRQSMLIGGTQALGTFYLERAEIGDLMNGQCHGNGLIGSRKTNFAGPVEQGHIIQVDWICNNGRPSLIVTETRAGEKVSESPVELKCRRQ